MTAPAIANPFDPAKDPEHYRAWESTEPAPEPPTPPRGRHVVSIRADALTMRIPKWLWEQRIPTAGITLLAGREGIGKSTLSFDLAARVTRGELEGRCQGRPRGVVIIAGEDDLRSVILPRLLAARADLARVAFVKARTEEERTEPVSVPRDLDGLGDVVAEVDAALILVDPIMSVLPTALDTHKDRDVRQALDPLAAFAQRTGVAVVGLIHVNKSGGTDPLNTLMASRAFSAVARSVLYCMVDPEEEGDDRYVLTHAKSNLGPKRESLRYHITAVTMQVEPDEDGETDLRTSRITWDGEDSRGAREILEASTAVQRPGGQATEDILAWVVAADRVVTTGEILAAFPSSTRAKVDKTLSRLVQRGRLERPVHGSYRAPRRSDRRSDASPMPVRMPERSDVSVPVPTGESHKTYMTEPPDLTDLALSGTRGQVSECGGGDDWAVEPLDWE